MNTKNKITCPFCQMNIVEEKTLYHFGKSHSDTMSVYDYFCEIYTQDTIDKLIERYVSGVSLNELWITCTKEKHLFGLSQTALIKILSSKNIFVRTLKESQSQKVTREKVRASTLRHYGVENPSQASEIKVKKAQTFIDHYGVDNIRKSQEFKEYVDKVMLERYGTKRVSGYANKTDEEKKAIVTRMVQTFHDRGLYHKLNWTSGLESRLKRIFDEQHADYKYQFFIDGKYFDFLYNRILIELNGDYWHANPAIYESEFLVRGIPAKQKWEKDNVKRELALSSGYKLLIFWEHSFNAMTDKQIIETINSFTDKQSNYMEV